jgi:hypothetical protein
LLTHVQIPDPVESIEQTSFHSCFKLRRVTFSMASRLVWNFGFFWCPANWIEIRKSLAGELMTRRRFEQCTTYKEGSLAFVTIPESFISASRRSLAILENYTKLKHFQEALSRRTVVACFPNSHCVPE